MGTLTPDPLAAAAASLAATGEAGPFQQVLLTINFDDGVQRTGAYHRDPRCAFDPKEQPPQFLAGVTALVPCSHCTGAGRAWAVLTDGEHPSDAHTVMIWSRVLAGYGTALVAADLLARCEEAAAGGWASTAGDAHLRQFATTALYLAGTDLLGGRAQHVGTAIVIAEAALAAAHHQLRSNVQLLALIQRAKALLEELTPRWAALAPTWPGLRFDERQGTASPELCVVVNPATLEGPEDLEEQIAYSSGDDQWLTQAVAALASSAPVTRGRWLTMLTTTALGATYIESGLDARLNTAPARPLDNEAARTAMAALESLEDWATADLSAVLDAAQAATCTPA